MKINPIVLIFMLTINPVFATPSDDKACAAISRWLYENNHLSVDMTDSCNVNTQTKTEWECVKKKITIDKDNYTTAVNKCFK